jgi:hypothetical protein
MTLWGLEGQDITGTYFPSTPIEATVLRPGTYILVVTTPDVGPVDYTIQRTSTGFPSTPLTGFDLVQEAAIVPGGQASFSFSAPAGRLVFVDGLESNPQGLLCSIQGPSGYSLGSFSPNGGTGDDSPPFLLSESGTFNFTVWGVSISEPRTYRFRLRDVQGESVPLPLGEIASGTLETGRETDLYYFDGTIGQKLYFDSLQADLSNVIIQLISPSRSTATTINQDGQSLTLTESGRYYVLVRGNTSSPSEYRFRLVDLDAAPLVTIGDLITGNLDTPVETAFYRFEGRAGQRLYFDGLGTEVDVNVRLVGPDGYSIPAQMTNGISLSAHLGLIIFEFATSCLITL